MTLYSIVEAAAVLVDAEYAALGVIGPDGKRLSAFHTSGVTEEQMRGSARTRRATASWRADPPPRAAAPGEDLGAPVLVRLPAAPPADEHLPGCPHPVRDQVFGNLYLTEKRGGAQFDEEDVSVTLTLAVAAGVAIDNKRANTPPPQPRPCWHGQ